MISTRLGKRWAGYRARSEAEGGFDFVQRLALLDEASDLGLLLFEGGQQCLDVGFLQRVAVAGDEGVGVQGQDPLEGLDQAERCAALLAVDERVAAYEDQITDKGDFLAREVDDQVAAGVRRPEVEQLHTDAVDVERPVPERVWSGRYGESAFIFGSLKASSMSLLVFAWARMGSPLGKADKPLTWSPSLWVRTMFSTGFGVSFRISASTALEDSSVILESMTTTPCLPMTKPVLRRSHP